MYSLQKNRENIIKSWRNKSEMLESGKSFSGSLTIIK